MGIFSNRNFIVPNEIKDKVSQEEKEAYYLEHVKHVVDLIGVDYVAVATDDMDFCKRLIMNTLKFRSILCRGWF